MNYDKSTIFFSKHLPGSRAREILDETSFSEDHFPFIFFGVPIEDGRLKIRHFMPLLERVEKKLLGLKSRLLSQGAGKIDFIMACTYEFTTPFIFSFAGA